MLSRSGKKEGIDFKHNKWIFFIVLAAITGAISGLYDKYLMKSLNPMLVQSWYNVYQVFIMCPILLLLWWPKEKVYHPVSLGLDDYPVSPFSFLLPILFTFTH